MFFSLYCCNASLVRQARTNHRTKPHLPISTCKQIHRLIATFHFSNLLLSTASDFTRSNSAVKVFPRSILAWIVSNNGALSPTMSRCYSRPGKQKRPTIRALWLSAPATDVGINAKWTTILLACIAIDRRNGFAPFTIVRRISLSLCRPVTNQKRVDSILAAANRRLAPR